MRIRILRNMGALYGNLEKEQMPLNLNDPSRTKYYPESGDFEAIQELAKKQVWG